jgi:hypothetical protein
MMPIFNRDPRALVRLDYCLSKRVFAGAIAITGWCAVILHLYLAISDSLISGGTVGAAILKDFSFFTILTNAMIAFCLTLVAIDPEEDRFWNFPSVMAALTLYIIVVAIINAALLESLWHPQGLKLVADRTLHAVIPVSMVAYWLIFAPKGLLRVADTLLWLPYPFLYMGYTLGRGAIIGTYPYPFLDVIRLGYSGVLFNGVLLLLLFAGLALLLVLIDRALHSQASRETNF